MDRRQFLAASSIGLAATMAGCTGSQLNTDDPGAADDPGSESDASESDGEITVGASGEVETEPDRAIVTVGVEATGETASDVTDELATGAEQLRAAFDDLDIPEENVEEGRYRVHPASGRDAQGFEGAHSFEVTLTDIERVGDVIDASIDAGADNVGRVNFTLQEDTRSTLREDAIDAALENADEEAAHIADNRGVDLAGTTSVTTGDVQVNPVRVETYASAGAADDAAASTEIDADPVSVSASVTVTYAFAE
ncbi:SIMPL domain-containing protein [Natrinema longum]|uniref:SIMPL domain-containing protein n=1 Tax=Natrinema longum TaxID=370324 RepID=A0A8A2UCV2_9EURY|nr:SIMPL domain-containing protein [Natrinema longum]MBZ6495507.1 SIMPL domain-containing protein [Natrinema longum]QSW86526.1 SIMPL domain-containing protein [Natrinema longum]